MYCLFRLLVEHSKINIKFLTYVYLNEKPTNIDLIKFPGLCPFVLSRYLKFISIFFTSLILFNNHILFLHKSKELMTIQKSRLCSTMVLSCPWLYYQSSCICISFFIINRSVFVACKHFFKSTSILTLGFRQLSPYRFIIASSSLSTTYFDTFLFIE